MRGAKLTTDKGYTWTTDCNGTDAEITAYFLGQTFNVGVFPTEDMQKVVLCEVLD